MFNKQTLILIAAAGLILIPTGVALHAFSVDRFEKLTQEGGTAFCVAILDVADAEQSKPLTPLPKPSPEPATACKCNGTGFILSGDGIAKIHCGCGKDCKCQKYPKDNGPEVKTSKNRLLLFTAPSYCKPCRQLEETTLPALKAVGWTFGPKANIEVISVDASTENSYNLHLDEVPTWVLISADGKREIKRYVGYVNASALTRMWNGEELIPSDYNLIDYKTKKEKSKSVKWIPHRNTPLKGERSQVMLSGR